MIHEVKEVSGMLIDGCGREVIPDSEDKLFEFGKDRHYVSGFFYIPGFRCGFDSCAEVQRSLDEENRIPFERMYGMYGAYVYTIVRENETYCFSANGRMGTVYYGEEGFSSRLLDLVRYYNRKNECLSFDESSVCEFLTLKKVFFGKTLINGLHILPSYI